MGIEPARLALNRQVHGATVTRAEPGERGRDADGLWTDEPGVPMLAFSADCLPIGLARVNGTPGLALLHAGRLGLLDGVVEAGVAALGGRLTAVIGPGIGPCCYEVGEEVAAPYRARFGPDVMRGRNLDLWTAAERVLRSPVSSPSNCSTSVRLASGAVFSHRRNGPVTGRQGVVGYVA